MTPETFKTVKELASLGGWVVLASFFMGQAAGYIPSAASAAVAKIEEHEHREGANRASLEQHRIRQEILIERLTTALRVLCENNARGDRAALNNCNNIR